MLLGYKLVLEVDLVQPDDQTRWLVQIWSRCYELIHVSVLSELCT